MPFLTTLGDTTGETSVFTHWNAYQIMFHCAPYLPFNPSDTQQVERRRFIGNDIVRDFSSLIDCRTKILGRDTWVG